jgi:ubiquinone/menaquinone biosynthesis C-methylase UbiE
MNNEQIIAQHYQHESLLSAIVGALAKQQKPLNVLSIDDLAPVDEFHIGGRLASEHFFKQLPLNNSSQVLDIGCGLGGAARFVAQTYHAMVSGIDLSKEYIETGNILSQWLKLTDKVKLQQGSALNMPYISNSFHCAYMMHVGMNIQDKQQLFNEVYRLLKKNSYFGLYDVMRLNDGELNYPVPWASESKNSYLSTLEQYRACLMMAGFEVITVNNRREFSLDYFEQVRRQHKAKGRPILGLHTLMQASTSEKLTNLHTNIENYIIAPIEIIARKC